MSMTYTDQDRKFWKTVEKKILPVTSLYRQLMDLVGFDSFFVWENITLEELPEIYADIEKALASIDEDHPLKQEYFPYQMNKYKISMAFKITTRAIFTAISSYNKNDFYAVDDS